MSPQASPIGMVDELPATPRQQSPFEQAAVRFVLGTAASDPAIVERLKDPVTRAALAAAEVEQRARDWPNIGQYRDENMVCRAQGSPKVVFFGTSVTEIWRHADPELFSNGIVGRGISGQTTPQSLLRFYPDVVALKPTAVHFVGGGNDIAGNTGPSTPQDYKNNIMAMLDIAQANNIRVLLGSIPPAGSYGWRPEINPVARVAELNVWLNHTAAARGAIFIDYFTALAAEDRSMRAEFTNDGVHPNAAGYAIMRPLVLAALAELFGAV